MPKPTPAAAAPKGPGGHPPFVPTQVQRDTVKVMVAGGIQETLIAGVFGISPRTLSKHFRKEIANGTTEVAAVVIAAHLKRIRAGDMNAIKWWEQARLGWSDKAPLDDPRSNMPMRVVIELVGDAAPLTIDHDQTARAAYEGAQFVELVG